MTEENNEAELKAIEKKEKQLKRQEKALARQKEREAKKQTKKQDDDCYVTNKELLAELQIYQETGVITNALGIMLTKIATKLTNHSSFRNYNYDVKQEMVSYARFKAIQGICNGNYNFKFNNPFAYFTQCCWNANLTVLSKYYKQINIKRSNLERALHQLEAGNTNINVTKIVNNYIKNYLGLDSEDTNDI